MCEKEPITFTTDDGRVVDVEALIALDGNPEEIVQNLKLSTGERHSFMYKFAEANPNKGKQGGSCNVTQCQKKGASCYNGSTRAYYCTKCWDDIYHSATYGGLQEVDWIKAEDRKEDFSYDITLGEVLKDLDELRDKVRKVEKQEYRGRVKNPYLFDKGFGHEPWVREQPKVGRNSPCPCGSGKKYKKCCLGILGD